MSNGAVEGIPRIVLRIEGMAILVLSVAFYAMLDIGWLPFVVLILVPDLSLLGYLLGPKVGANAYNAAHSYAWAAGLLLLGTLGVATATMIGLIWAAHVGLDRMLGLGLKYPSGFAHTHLGMIGRPDAVLAPSSNG
jgi:hypothetical protein